MNIVKNKPRSIFVMIMIICSLLITANATIAAQLTASTNLIIVDVGDFRFNSAPATLTYTGDWPQSPDTVTPTGQEVYMSSVYFTHHSMSWSTIPQNTPYPIFPNTVNSMVAAVWPIYKTRPDGSLYEDGEKWNFGSWDYLATNTHGKGTEKGMPSCLMGTLVHTVCDRKPGECNGRYKSNLIFSNWPTGLKSIADGGTGCFLMLD